MKMHPRVLKKALAFAPFALAFRLLNILDIAISAFD
jgi:hypothetical protein